METFLDSEDFFDDVIMQNEPPKGAAGSAEEKVYKVWEKKNKQTRTHILLTLSEEIAMTLMREKKAKLIWEALKKKYEGFVTTRQIDVYVELTRISMKDDEKVETYINRALSLVHRRMQLGKQVTDAERIGTHFSRTGISIFGD